MTGLLLASPRPRGSTYTVDLNVDPEDGFPASAGIDSGLVAVAESRLGLPRVRGDRPRQQSSFLAAFWASPRPRGSTGLSAAAGRAGRGFPASAGIDPWTDRTRAPTCRLPRVRGDRPLRLQPPARQNMASPRPRGSTPVHCARSGRCCGFPASAGIDPQMKRQRKQPRRLPRVRGDRPKGPSASSPSAKASPRPRGSTP